MDAVIKVGGSLAEPPETLKALGEELSSLAKSYRIAVVPGGGKFADAVRELDSKFSLPAAVSHRMAILAMDQYGLLLSQAIPQSLVSDSLSAVKQLSDLGKIPIFLPSKFLKQNDPFEPSWNVTSDSIAAFVAAKLSASKAIFATDVDGIYARDPKKYAKEQLLSKLSVDELSSMESRTSVDKYLPIFLKKHPIDCYVVNGKHPERIRKILLAQETVCTRIFQASSG